MPAKINVEKLFGHLGYHPHPGQQDFHGSSARFKVLDAGRRFGKSEVGAAELNVEAFSTKLMLKYLEDKGQRREFWIVGPEYSDAEKEFRKHYDALKRVGAPFDRPGTYNNPHTGDMHISMYGGKYLCSGMSAKYPDTLVGEGLSGVVMAEAAKLRERVWTKFIRPALADFKGWAIFSSTPEGKNWFYDLFMRGPDPMFPNWESWRAPAWHNPYVYPKGGNDRGIELLRGMLHKRVPISQRIMEDAQVDPEIVDLLMTLSEETFKQEIAADFTEFAGRVFKEFDDEYHVRDLHFDPARKTYAAVDYGFTNPFVWLYIQEDLWGNVYVLDEIYETGLSIDDAARLVVERGLHHHVIQFFPDPAEPGDTLALERHLRLGANRDTGGELKLRLRYIREALRDRNPHLPDGHIDRHPKLMVDRRCTNFIREFNDYRYPRLLKDQEKLNPTNPGDLPLKKDDHTPEALGRFYRGRYGPTGDDQGGRSKVARSTLSGRPAGVQRSMRSRGQTRMRR